MIRRKVSRGSGGSDNSIRFNFLNEVLKMPLPKWLIESFLTLQSMAMLYGCPGVGKTFIAIDIALSVAMGLEWFGNKTSAGSVVMVSTEGNLGLQLRLKGWELERKIPLKDAKNLLVCFDPIDFSKEKFQKIFLEKIEAMPESPKLIIIDTFADCFAQCGGNENDSGSVGKFIGGIKRITEQTGAATLMIHHTKKGFRTERGSTVLRAAMDSMYLVRQTKSGEYHITPTKQRNFASGKGEDYILKEITLPSSIGAFELSATCVPEKIKADSLEMLRVASKISDNQKTVLDLLGENNGLRQSEIREKTGLAKSSLSEALKRLTENGFVKPVGGLYCLTDSGIRFTGTFGSGDKGNPPEPNGNTLVNLPVAENEQQTPASGRKYKYHGNPRYANPQFRGYGSIAEELEDNHGKESQDSDGYRYDDDWDYDPKDFEDPEDDDVPF